MPVRRKQFGLLNVRDLARGTSAIIDKVEREHACFIVTRHGTPVATLTPIDPEALEDFILAQAPEFVRSRRRAERELSKGKTASLSNFLEEPKDTE